MNPKALLRCIGILVISRDNYQRQQVIKDALKRIKYWISTYNIYAELDGLVEVDMKILEKLGKQYP